MPHPEQVEVELNRMNARPFIYKERIMLSVYSSRFCMQTKTFKVNRHSSNHLSRPLFLVTSRISRINSTMARSESYPIESTTITSVHVTALDGLVNVNSLFTVAVFVGLSLTPGQHSLENPSACDAGIDVAEKLLVFEVVSFSFFLSSSLVAQGLKLAINLLNSKDANEIFKAHINLKMLRFGMLGSAVGSVMGCLFLMLSMVNVIQIRLGMLSCGSKPAVHSVVALVVLMTSALAVYISTVVYSFFH